MSRVGEWDCPRRGFQQYFDRHVDSPIQYVSGHNDHFIDVDFSGWSCFSLIEAENGTRPPVEWPKPCGSYLSQGENRLTYSCGRSINTPVRARIVFGIIGDRLEDR